MAALAQQESQSLSQNVKLGLQYRYQQGEIQINCSRFLGYDKDENKHLVIIPEEAEVVKRIYREYLEGSSMLKIPLYQTNIATVLSKENDQTLTVIDNQLEELQTQLLKLASSKADYEDVADEIYRLRE